ncbi:ATP-dependent DNA helicase [Candidatus Woesearchaeota archaeon]|nr:ATP-dependent DNA helicase [Candidatus Woesearchaeota archaeon]
MDLKSILFPHDRIRPIQEAFINDVLSCLEKQKCLIVHAPTGLGKTAASLCPALSFAQKKNLTVFFLTSRHTQHKIVIDTVRAIKQKYGVTILTTSVIGKKHMCLQSNVESMRSNDFTEYCKYLRENNKCDYYANVRTKQTAECKIALAELKKNAPSTTEEVISLSSEARVCPYEISLLTAEKSQVIIADYYYLFNSSIRNSFLAKTKKELQNAVIIIDEAHNLPSRLRELLTKKLTNLGIKRAIKEAKELKKDDLISKLVELQDILNKLSKDLKNHEDRKVEQSSFTEAVERFCRYDDFVDELEDAGDLVRDEQKQSSLGALVGFLKSWPDESHGFCRVVKRDDLVVSLSHRCLDPSVASKDVIDAAYSTILMSGTLTPTTMYKDLLGFPKDTVEKEFKSHFPQQNKLALIIPKTTTKFTERNDAQFQMIAKVCADIVNEIPGSCAVFFPSYHLRDAVNNYFQNLCEKTLLLEQPDLSKDEKQKLLDKLKNYGLSGAVLLGTAAGSFGEGVDLPGVLKAVIVVGLPLDRPTLETQELINYYDARFGKGWDYGYTLPALTKCLQNAGRCIRSETDRGVIVFLDQRYTHPNYLRCFPNEWQLKISVDYIPLIKNFFTTPIAQPAEPVVLSGQE